MNYSLMNKAITGSKKIILATVKPPIPESKIPIGAFDFSTGMSC